MAQSRHRLSRVETVTTLPWTNPAPPCSPVPWRLIVLRLTEVTELEKAILADQNVTWFDITMNDLSGSHGRSLVAAHPVVTC